MPCEWVLTSNCHNNHLQTWKCHQTQPLTCRSCDREAKRAAEKQQKDFELQQKRDAERQAHDEKMAKIREKLDARVRAQEDLGLAKEREAALKQQGRDVKDMEERLWREAEVGMTDEELKMIDEELERVVAEQVAVYFGPIAATMADNVKSTLDTLIGTQSKPLSPENTGKEGKEEEKKKEKESEAQSDWQRRKDIEGVANPHIYAIMEMIGLEPVKQQILRIMDKVNVKIRQGTPLSKERFNAVFLGNPGTGIICLLVPHRILTDDTL